MGHKQSMIIRLRVPVSLIPGLNRLFWSFQIKTLCMWVFSSFIALKNFTIIVEFFRSNELFAYKILRLVAHARLVHNFRNYPDFLNRFRSLNENVYMDYVT